MGRFKCGVRLSRDSGLPSKRDTPVKTALSRRDKCRRLLPKKQYEAFPEELELEELNVLTVKPVNPVLTGIKHVCSKSVLRLSSPAFPVNPRGKAVSPAAPANKKSGHRVSSAGHPTMMKMTPDADAFRGGEMPVKEEEQTSAVTPEGITSSSMESDTTFSSDDDDEEEEEEEEEDCYSFASASTASSSLPSPEIFRKEDDVVLAFPIKEELLDLHLDIKNSTLLDVSYAKSIHMHHPLILSAITDTSVIHADNNCAITQHRGPEAEIKIHMDSFKSDNEKTPLKLTNRRPISYKKKVWFRSPMIAETFEAKYIPAPKLIIPNAGEPVRTSSPAEQKKPDTDVSRAGDMSSEDKPLRLNMRPVKSRPEKAKFFDFIDDSDQDVFFKKMRERCVKLKSAPPFPLMADKRIEPSVL